MFSRQAIRSVWAAAPQRVLAMRATTAPVRSFAAAANAEVQPPVAVFGVDGTYATALVRFPMLLVCIGYMRRIGVDFASGGRRGGGEGCDVMGWESSCSRRHLPWRRTRDARHQKESEEEASTANVPCQKQYTAAAKSSTLDPTAKAIAALGALLQKDPKLAEILSAPTLTEADKKAIVTELTKQAGVQGATIKNFLDALAENNRLGLLGDVCDKFSTIISAARGEVEMKVTSAQVWASPFASFFLSSSSHFMRPLEMEVATLGSDKSRRRRGFS